MRITKLRIPAFQQFRDLDLPFTDPVTGQALDSVCFIGANGTGKTTLLRLIRGFLESLGAWDSESWAPEKGLEYLLFTEAESKGAEVSVLADSLGTTPASFPAEQRGQLRLDDPQRDRVISVTAGSGDASALPDSNLDQALRLFKRPIG